jgi:hypothetical protein
MSLVHILPGIHLYTSDKMECINFSWFHLLQTKEVIKMMHNRVPIAWYTPGKHGMGQTFYNFLFYQ